MSDNVVGFAIFLGYVAASAITAGALYMDLQSVWPERAAQNHRQVLAAAIGFGLIPVMWFVAPFITGFYEHGVGFQWREKK